MDDRATKLIREMANELPGLVASAVVHLEDGLSIAEVNKREDIDASAAAAYLASIVQSNLQALRVLADDQVTDDILITTDKNYYLIKHTQGKPYFIFAMTEKDEWLGRARLIMREYEKLVGEALASL